MAYIGKTPITGNFVKLDAITVVNGQAGYTMNNGGSAFTDYENVNQFLVSLNGILQAPTDSFTVSGSTLTFASNLSTGDVIDFVIVLGNTLDIGTPSDSTVTQAKTNFVSTSSSAGLQIKGDGTTDGTLQLNCSQNSHGIKLKSPAHSAGASYTLTFPTTDGNADEFLQTNGSGTLTWAEASGGLVLIKEVVASNVSAVTFVHGTSDVVFDTTYKAYLFVFSQVIMAGDEEIFLRATISGSPQTSSYVQSQYGGYLTSNKYLDHYTNSFFGSPGDVDAAIPMSGFVYFYGAGGSSIYPQAMGQVINMRSNNDNYMYNFGSYRNSTTSNFDGFTFTNNGGPNITSGNFKLYGLK